MKIALSLLCGLLPAFLLAADRPPNVLTEDERDDGWKLLFDGKTLNGWHASGKPDAFTVKDGAIVVSGADSYLYYDGPVGNHDFKGFELDMEVKTAPKAMSGVFFHTELAENGPPPRGYEVQINNKGNDPNRTGSLTGVKEYTDASANDGEWFHLNVFVDASTSPPWWTAKRSSITRKRRAPNARTSSRSGSSATARLRCRQSAPARCSFEPSGCGSCRTPAPAFLRIYQSVIDAGAARA